ncbi:MAG: hypothetical protein LBL90_03890 [Prevotellaceae bacterium]|jgi:alanine dehydrogenase|nr:hypothetical protein [Prevotellaceae bacterium]
MKQISNVISSFLTSYKIDLYEQEEKLGTLQTKKQFTICVPKEITVNEKRVPLTPEGVELLIAYGYKVVIEKDAGLNSDFSNTEYSDCGAVIGETPEEAYKGDIILKLNHPQQHEIEMIPEGKIVVSNLHKRKPTIESIQALIKRKITGIAVEYITDHSGRYSIRNTLFPIEGKAVMLMAAELLTNERGGQGILLGGIAGIAPVEVVIIGAGVVAEHAAQVATVLGAIVKIFSSSIGELYVLKQKLGQSLFTNMLHKQALIKALHTADVVINTVNFEEHDLSFRLNEDYFKVLKKRTVVLDMSGESEMYFEDVISQGFNRKLFKKYNIIYHCMTNVSSRVARTSSMSLNNIAIEIIDQITQSANFIQLLRKDKGLCNGIYAYNGILTNSLLGRMYNMPYQDINLLLAAF